MKKTKAILFVAAIIVSACASQNKDRSIVTLAGEFHKWQPVVFDITGPETSEHAEKNPFLDYRVDVTIKNDKGSIFVVPGYFAADGDASESGAKAGNVWKAVFSPPDTGTWTYHVSFLEGKNISVSDSIGFGKQLYAHGKSGTFDVKPVSDIATGFYKEGRLQKKGHYLFYSETGNLFLKGGTNSPENFLAYHEFDGTYFGGLVHEDVKIRELHKYEAHIADFNEGMDPVWQQSKGKGILGVVNYLASYNMNSIYFLTFNILGDGDDVWPYTDRNERYRFDCSKLDQWDILFTHMMRKGVVAHMVLQETETEHVLDGGYLDVQRKVYLRELIARFAHHPGVIWNLGEEHGPVRWMNYYQTSEDAMKMAAYIKKIDPYNNLVVIHTPPTSQKKDENLSPYLGNKNLDGISLQIGQFKDTKEEMLKWTGLSADSGQKWVLMLDEIGPAYMGVPPDSVGANHDDIRKHALWPAFLTGGTGVEWYFGYRFPHNDLNCEDFRMRENIWKLTNNALSFFRDNQIPISEMTYDEKLTDNPENLSVRLGNELFVIYLPNGARSNVLTDQNGYQYSLQWFNPRQGGKPESEELKFITIKNGQASLGFPPDESNNDWLCILRKQAL